MVESSTIRTSLRLESTLSASASLDPRRKVTDRRWYSEFGGSYTDEPWPYHQHWHAVKVRAFGFLPSDEVQRLKVGKRGAYGSAVQSYAHLFGRIVCLLLSVESLLARSSF